MCVCECVSVSVDRQQGLDTALKTPLDYAGWSRPRIETGHYTPSPGLGGSISHDSASQVPVKETWTTLGSGKSHRPEKTYVETSRRPVDPSPKQQMIHALLWACTLPRRKTS